MNSNTSLHQEKSDFENYINQVISHGYETCDIRFAVLHSKKNTDYRLLFFLGYFCNDTESKIYGLDNS